MSKPDARATTQCLKRYAKAPISGEASLMAQELILMREFVREVAEDRDDRVSPGLKARARELVYVEAKVTPTPGDES